MTMTFRCRFRAGRHADLGDVRYAGMDRVGEAKYSGMGEVGFGRCHVGDVLRWYRRYSEVVYVHRVHCLLDDVLRWCTNFHSMSSPDTVAKCS
jgi:hypothetical protein